MPLSVGQRAQLHSALSHSFSRAELAQLIYTHFGLELDSISGPGSIAAIVTDLMAWASRTGNQSALIAASCAERPNQAEMRSLCAAALSWDLDAPVPSDPVSPLLPQWPVLVLPNQEPGLVIGRDELLADLSARLYAGRNRALALEGTGWVGKSTLALKLAYEPAVREYFRDGVLWAELGHTAQGDERDAAVAAVQAEWANALDLSMPRSFTVAQRQAAIARFVGNRRVLVVLDDVWDEGAAAALRIPMPGVVHLLTTRDAEIALQFAGDEENVVKLPVLDEATAWALFRRLAPSAPPAARKLVESVGGLPRAVELLAGHLGPARAARAAVFAGQATTLLDELADPSRRLALATEQLGSHGKKVTLEQVIAFSVESLQRSHPAAVSALYALGAFAPKPAVFDLAAAQAVTGADVELLMLLHTRNLIEAQDTLALHQVLSDFIRPRVSEVSVIRHRQYYLAVAEADRWDLQNTEAAWGQIAHAWAAIPDADGDALLAFCTALNTFFSRRGLHQEQVEWNERALAAVVQPQARATALTNAASAYDAMGQRLRALNYYEQALLLMVQVGDQRGEAAARFNIAMAAAGSGDMKRAEQELEQVITLDEAMGHSDLASDRAALERLRARRSLGEGESGSG